MAGLDVGDTWLLMDSPLSAQRVAEMLDRIGQVDVVAGDARGRQRLVEDPAGRADERLTLDVLAIPRLLAHEHHAGTSRTLREHDLRGVLPEIAPSALGGRSRQ